MKQDEIGKVEKTYHFSQCIVQICDHVYRKGTKKEYSDTCQQINQIVKNSSIQAQAHKRDPNECK